jgi:hypothetical protein
VENELATEAHPFGFERVIMSLVPHFIEWLSNRRLTALLLLVTSVLTIFPMTLPIGTREPDSASEGKDLSEPFPCQARACGCRSAKQCWKKCCCFTNAQKLAWAKANRVQVPTFVVEAAEREAADKAVVAKSPARKAEACCSTTGSCHQQTAAALASVKTLRTAPRSKFVVGIQALQCQGIEQSLLGQLISLQPPVLTTLIIDSFDQGEVVPPLRCAPLIPCDQEPPTPPPRQAA